MNNSAPLDFPQSIAPINRSLDYYKKEAFGQYLEMDGLTEIAVNRPFEVLTEINGKWSFHKNENITLEMCQRFARSLASFKKDEISEVKPLLSATLESGERVQVVFPPACEDKTVSITIRKPSTRQISHKEYIESGFYHYVSSGEKKKNVDDELLELYCEKKFAEFIELAVYAGKTILIAAGTGAGKTTYMKSLIPFIPLDVRIITIEDTEELKFSIHKNYVHLYYPSEAGNTSGSIITAGSLIKSCYRMKPDRILLAEVRGGEAWDFLKVISSGHSGSMTTVHAGSVHEAIEGIIERCYQNSECNNLTYDVLRKKVLESIDIILPMGRDGVQRYLNDIYYKAADYENV